MDSVYDRVPKEHAVLRAKLTALLRTCLAARDDEKRRPEVVAALAALDDAVRAHLAYEEEHMFPVLRVSDAWGSIRVDALREQHAAQRAALTALVEDAGEGGRPLAEVADEIAWFARGFERDMRHEEEGLEDRRDTIVPDQIDG